jgi:GNAT superfamily N-acetyltransferase
VTDWQPRLLRPGEEPELLDLFTTAFGTWPKPEIEVPAIDHLRWKLEIGRDPHRAVVVEDGGGIIAGVLISFRDINLQGRVLCGTSGGDLAVRPDYQGKRVFSAMTWYLRDLNRATADVSYGYRSQNIAVQRALPPMGRGIFGNYVNVLVAKPDAVAAPSVPWDLRVVECFDDRVDGLWKSAAAEFDFIAGRSHRYLNWRFCDVRGGNFRVLTAEQDDRLLGYAVARVSHGTGYLADLLALPGRLDVVKSLTREVLTELASQAIDEVRCWLPSRHIYFDALAGLGFSAIKTTQDLTYQPLRTPETELSLLLQPQARVHFTAGDTDLV